MKNYIKVFLVVFLGYFVVQSIYTEMNKDKTPGKAKRLECQKLMTTFERGYSDKDIKKGQIQLASGDVKFSSTIEKSVYAKSELFNYVKLKDTDKMFSQELEKYIKEKQHTSKPLKITYNIYENDVKDPGKKTKKSKVYAGYVVSQIKNENNKTIYQVQIDFMDKKGADIAQSLQCSIKSFATYNKEKK